MSQEALLTQAKQGDGQAMAQLMNAKLASQGVTVKAVNDKDCLKFTFTSQFTPNQTAAVNYMRNVFTKLSVTNVRKVLICGKPQDQEQPSWQEEFTLPLQTAPEPQPQAAATPSFSVPTVSPSFRPIASPNISIESVYSGFWFYSVFWWTGFLLTFGLNNQMPGHYFFVAALGFIGLALYRHWSLFQNHGAAVKPQTAVALCFVPFFCCYWWFTAFIGIVGEHNQYLRRYHLSQTKMSYLLSILLCVLGCVWVGLHFFSIFQALLPSYILPVTQVSVLIVGYLVELNRRNAVLAILRHQKTYGN